MNRALALAAACWLPAAQAAAFDETTVSFLESNLLSTFYHEVGHAFIDVLDLAVLGQEEDAADSLSVVLIDRYYDEETAVEIIADTAAAYAAYSEEAGDDVIFWGVHDTDEQRYYNTICLFYGGDTEGRADLAEDLGLPEGRAETCEEEFELARDSWEPALEEVHAGGERPAFEFVPSDETDKATVLLNDLMEREIEWLNERMTLPVTVEVWVERCDEENAFYFPSERLIIMCVELAEDLARLAP